MILNVIQLSVMVHPETALADLIETTCRKKSETLFGTK